MRASLEAHVQQRPEAFGQTRSRWSLTLLRETVTALSGLSVSGVWRVLRRLDIRYKRGREYVHSPDPEYAAKMARVAVLVAEARESNGRIVVVFEDELTFYRRPSVNRAYARVGAQQAKVNQGHGPNSKSRLASFLNCVTGECFTWQRSAFTKATLKRFYKALAARYPDADVIYVIQDNWPVHFLPDIVEAAAKVGVELVRLPTYAPWTNPVEKIWLNLKRELLHHHPFPDNWPGLKHAVNDWLSRLDQPSPELLRSVGLLPC
jgi:transposase